MKNKSLSIMFLVFCLILLGMTKQLFAGKLREKQIAERRKPVGSSAMRIMGKKLYVEKMCYTCHGTEGRKPIMDAYPNLAGQKSSYLFQQLLDIQSGKRSNGMSSMMKAVTKDISRAEFKAIAIYLSHLISKKNLKPSVVYDGQLLYREKMCRGCHGPKGENIVADNYPKLAGQNEQYLIQQLLDIKNKNRVNGMSKAMFPYLAETSKDELQKISKFLAKLPG